MTDSSQNETVGYSRHQVKLAIRWDKRDSSIVLEARQSDALVELYILQLHRLSFATAVGLFKHNFVVEAKSKLDWV